MARTQPRPNLVQDQGDRGSSRNPIPPTLLTSSLGMGSTIIRGTVNLCDTPVVTGFDDYSLDDSWN